MHFPIGLIAFAASLTVSAVSAGHIPLEEGDALKPFIPVPFVAVAAVDVLPIIVLPEAEAVAQLEVEPAPAAIVYFDWAPTNAADGYKINTDFHETLLGTLEALMDVNARLQAPDAPAATTLAHSALRIEKAGIEILRYQNLLAMSSIQHWRTQQAIAEWTRVDDERAAAAQSRLDPTVKLEFEKDLTTAWNSAVHSTSKLRWLEADRNIIQMSMRIDELQTLEYHDAEQAAEWLALTEASPGAVVERTSATVLNNERDTRALALNAQFDYGSPTPDQYDTYIATMTQYEAPDADQAMADILLDPITLAL